MRGFILLLAATCVPFSSSAEDFDTFLTKLKQDVAAEGLDVSILEQGLGADFKPQPKIKKKLNNQPESKFTFASYTGSLASDKRAEKGRKNFDENKEKLNEISGIYGVRPEVLVALWGIESRYGDLQGKFEIIPALTTLAYDSHRKPFFRKELFSALRIVQEGHITVQGLKGSWAGAMGQCQFIPSSFISYAADGNSDGKKDIWNTKADVFASSANYLKKHGWNSGEKWGQRVQLNKILPPIDFYSRGLTKNPKTIAEWKKLGVTPKKGELLANNKKAWLFIPDGPSGKAWLVYNNFRTVMRWNNSSYFAFSVMTLADKIADEGGGG